MKCTVKLLKYKKKKKEKKKHLIFYDSLRDPLIL